MATRVTQCAMATLGLARAETALGQGLTLVHFSAQFKPFWSHLRVSPCLIDRGGNHVPNVSNKMWLR